MPPLLQQSAMLNTNALPMDFEFNHQEAVHM